MEWWITFMVDSWKEEWQYFIKYFIKDSASVQSEQLIFPAVH